jgi:hypothetical protein
MGTRTPNDDRADALNRNNDAHKASLDNRSQQLDPQNAKYGGGNHKHDREDDE